MSLVMGKCANGCAEDNDLVACKKCKKMMCKHRCLISIPPHMEECYSCAVNTTHKCSIPSCKMTIDLLNTRRCDTCYQLFCNDCVKVLKVKYIKKVLTIRLSTLYPCCDNMSLEYHTKKFKNIPDVCVISVDIK
jgi:hypothetical protein